MGITYIPRQRQSRQPSGCQVETLPTNVRTNIPESFSQDLVSTRLYAESALTPQSSLKAFRCPCRSRTALIGGDGAFRSGTNHAPELPRELPLSDGHFILSHHHFFTIRVVMTTTTASPPHPAASVDDHIHVRERRLSVDDYLAMGRAGILDEDDRIELLNGRLIDMPPIGPSHSHSVDDITELFTRRLYVEDPPPARVRVQSPIQLDEHSAPEPDIVLYDPNTPRDRHPQPDDIFLVVEVAESSVEYDRDVKAPHYAAAGIPAYWLADLSNETLDVFRQPEDDGYAERHRHRTGDELTISTLPNIEAVPVGEIVEG